MTVSGGQMSSFQKFLIGLAAALIFGWLAHGPLGRGDAFVAGLENRSLAVVRNAEVPGVQVRFQRDPLARIAILSGPADAFQRRGQGQFPGLDDRIETIPGVAGLRWQDDPGGADRGLPLVLESLLLVVLAYLIGVGFGWLLFRPKHEGYL